LGRGNEHDSTTPAGGFTNEVSGAFLGGQYPRSCLESRAEKALFHKKAIAQELSGINVARQEQS
jgi:hypothetical protein